MTVRFSFAARLTASAAVLAAFAAPASANVLFPGPASVYAKVSIAEQRMQVVIKRGDGKKETYSWKISTGRKGFETPPGQFRPDYIDELHHSTKYENAPMPYSVFFNDGIAVHGTTELKRLGSPASHGCVRLDPQNAAVFFRAVADIGMERTAIIVEK
ncbi:L,D-transpeptidase [Mesorhizobium sp. BR1-1-16]|uniref:L,D-transpeptidase n=1 Tax=Mesorhizobium sp. BR1-1-16 TaxID=2876653 RepID=UPI001CC9BD04|nr:L,D-transpeptidase [Mesorhizobium sp. BR1-1-16]MBZ9935103.1 L,D-transpeptidase [Mesorhizobium sp. BR1-1-16]